MMNTAQHRTFFLSSVAALRIFAILEVSRGQNAFPNENNTHFFPENVENNTLSCAIPPYQNKSNAFQPQEGMCINIEENLLDRGNETQLQALAEVYAPFLYFHPMEQFTMSRVGRTFENASQGEIFVDNGRIRLVDDELNLTTLMRTTRDEDFVLFSHKFFFARNLAENISYSDTIKPQERSTPDERPEDSEEYAEYKQGDGFTKEGLSRAPIYYNVFDSGNGTLTFNYFFYFTWNGASNYGILTSYNGTDNYYRVQLEPWDVHEGDWESMSVTVCKSSIASQPLSLAFRQSEGFGQTYDCGLGECTFHKESDTHPVGFVALNSHSVYAFSAEEIIYDDPVLEFWVNLQEFLVVHRTAYADLDGNTRFFRPDFSNVVRMIDQRLVPDHALHSDFWVAYGGRWGRPEGNESELLIESDAVYCLDETTVNGTIPCPSDEEDPIFDLVMQMIGVTRVQSAIVEGAKLLISYLNDKQIGEAPYGPSVSAHYLTINSVGNAPLWTRIVNRLDSSETSEGYCRGLLEIPDTSIREVDEEVLPVDKNIYGIMVFCGFCTIGTLVYFLVWTKVMKVRPLFAQDEEGNYLPPKRRNGRAWVFHLPIVYSCSYVVMLVGIALFFVGYDQLLDLLGKFFNSDYSEILALFAVIGIVVMIVDTSFLVLLWLRCEDLWRYYNRSYFDLVNDEDGKKQFESTTRVKFDSPRVHACFAILAALLFLSLLLATLMAVQGVFNVGIAYSIGEVCRAVVGSLTGICFDLKAFGLKEIQCGEEFHDFCNEWAQQEMILTLWGSFIVCIAHYFLIGSGLMATIQIRSLRREVRELERKSRIAEVIAESEHLATLEEEAGGSEHDDKDSQESPDEQPSTTENPSIGTPEHESSGSDKGGSNTDQE